MAFREVLDAISSKAASVRVAMGGGESGIRCRAGLKPAPTGVFAKPKPYPRQHDCDARPASRRGGPCARPGPGTPTPMARMRHLAGCCPAGTPCGRPRPGNHKGCPSGDINAPHPDLHRGGVFQPGRPQGSPLRGLLPCPALFAGSWPFPLSTRAIIRCGAQPCLRDHGRVLCPHLRHHGRHPRPPYGGVRDSQTYSRQQGRDARSALAEFHVDINSTIS